MNIVVVVFPSLLLLSGAMGATPTPPPLCYSGQLPCVDNAECDPSSDECVCSSGFSGDPRIVCTDLTGKCLCTVNKDPVFDLFDNDGALKVNLPCSVSLVTAANLPTGCFIYSVVAHPEVRREGNRVFVNEIVASTVNPLSSFGVSGSGVAVTAGSNKVAVASGADGFSTATVADCGDLTIGYNATYGGGYIIFPTPTSSSGLCGDCNGTPEDVGSTSAANLAYVLEFVAETSLQKGPYETECESLYSVIDSDCSTDADRASAATVCEIYLQEFGVCVQNSNGGTASTIVDYGDVMSAFTGCLQSVCTQGSPTAACLNVNQLATDSGCAKPTGYTVC